MFYIPFIVNCIVSPLNFLLTSKSFLHFFMIKRQLCFKTLTPVFQFATPIEIETVKQACLRKEYWILMRREKWGHWILRHGGQFWIWDINLYHLFRRFLCPIPGLPFLWILIFIKMGWMMSNSLRRNIPYKFVSDLKCELFLICNNVSLNVQLQILSTKKPEM